MRESSFATLCGEFSGRNGAMVSDATSGSTDQDKESRLCPIRRCHNLSSNKVAQIYGLFRETNGFSERANVIAISLWTEQI
jgi:hypothetical protein